MAQAEVADEQKNNENNYKYSDIINVEEELERRKQIIELALSPIDNTWTEYNTGNKEIKVSYKQVGNSNLYTTRGAMSMDTKGNGTMLDYFKYQENGYNDIYNDPKNKDATTIDLRIIKLIDNDHQIVYNASESGFMLIGKRDFTYMRTRFEYDNYQFNGKKYNKIVGSLSYSVSKNNPYNIAESNNYVRANLERSGYVLFIEDSGNNNDNNDKKDLTKFNVVYVMSLDPSGSIPQWVVNSFAPSKGMEVEKFVKSWPNMMNTLKAREKNNWKKDFEPLFKQTDPKLCYKQENEKEKEKETEKEKTKENENDNTGNDQKED